MIGSGGISAAERSPSAPTCSGNGRLTKRSNPTQIGLGTRVQHERSYKTQFKRLLIGFVKDDPEAFYMPARIACAITLSLFATIFIAIGFSAKFWSLREMVRRADVSSLVGIYRALSAIQTQFLLLTNDDLPPSAGLYLLDNAGKVHYYMVSLADSIYLASVVASSLALFFYAVSMLVMVLDFRVQVIQARRGIWQFNEPKVIMKSAVTFIGAQISNGMLTYLVIAFILALIIIIFAWKLTQDVLWYILTTYTAAIVTLVAFACINPVIKLIVTLTIVKKVPTIGPEPWSFFPSSCLSKDQRTSPCGGSAGSASGTSGRHSSSTSFSRRWRRAWSSPSCGSYS